MNALLEEMLKGVKLVLDSCQVGTRLQMLEVEKILEENSVKSFFTLTAFCGRSLKRGWRQDGFSGFRKELLPEEILAYFRKITLEYSSSSAFLNIDVYLIILP